MSEPRDHFINPPPRRTGGLGIVRDADGRVLFAEQVADDPGQPNRMKLPGGRVEENEPILDGLVRAARHKLGITVAPGRLLAVHHMYEKDYGTHVSREGLNLLFDCGVLDEEQKWEFGQGVTAARWVAPEDLEDEVVWYTAKRVHAALRALAGGEVEMLADV